VAEESSAKSIYTGTGSTRMSISSGCEYFTWKTLRFYKDCGNRGIGGFILSNEADSVTIL